MYGSGALSIRPTELLPQLGPQIIFVGELSMGDGDADQTCIRRMVIPRTQGRGVCHRSSRW